MPPIPFIPSFGAEEGVGGGEPGDCGAAVEQPATRAAALSAPSTAALTDFDLDLNLGCMIVLACLRVHGRRRHGGAGATAATVE
jgi:hypothetical protein